MKRELGDGYELDDDPARIDLDAVHRYLSEEAYWSLGRPRETQEQMNAAAARLVGLYHGGELGVVRLHQHAAVVGPVALERSDRLLEGRHGHGDQS